MLDPRIDDLFEEVKKLKEAMNALAAVIDGIAWRAASPEERSGINIRGEIQEILEKKEA